MSEMPRAAEAALAAVLFAVDPHGTGVLLRGFAGPVREGWLVLLRSLLPPETPFRRVPLQIAEARLLGGLDLTATLASGRPVADRGLLAEADGGVLLLAMAERVAPTIASHLATVLDAGEVRTERDGLSLRQPTRLGVVALDEGVDDERTPTGLQDRLAFHVDLHQLTTREPLITDHDLEDVLAARRRLDAVEVERDAIQALTTTAAALGIRSLRAPLLALRAARAAAALEERQGVDERDAELAARLVLAPRATVLPATEPPPAEEARRDDQPPSSGDDRPQDPPPGERGRLEDVVLGAAVAAIPPGLLAELRLGEAGRSRARQVGRAGVLHKATRRGRPAGVRRGEPRGGARLSVIETLRAAAPWQPLRRQTSGAGSDAILIRKDDLRIARFKEHSRTTVIFTVDASGSAALHRLAEAKGAVELLLAECYVRRDQVALVAFRGGDAELLLPPTRSLVRAKRSLQGLPGGGGTPLAAGIEAAWRLAEAARRRGDTPVVVVLTDGRANIARDGSPGRERARDDAVAAARWLRRDRLATILIDTSPRPQAVARQLADEMSAHYMPLPHADARELSCTIRRTALMPGAPPRA